MGIISLAGERLVVLLLDDEDDVARNRVRSLIRFALEDNLLVVSHALFDVNLEHLLLLDNLLRLAHLALILFADRLTRTAARVAHRLHLLHHARRDLSNNHLDARAPASVARAARARLAPFPVALFTNHVSRRPAQTGSRQTWLQR